MSDDLIRHKEGMQHQYHSGTFQTSAWKLLTDKRLIQNEPENAIKMVLHVRVCVCVCVVQTLMVPHYHVNRLL